MPIVEDADFLTYVGSEIAANQPNLEASLAAAELAVNHHCRRRFVLAGTPRSVTDGVTTISDATVTSATAVFNATDIGQTIVGTGITVGTTIASVTSATSIELSAVATASGTGLTLTITSTPRLYRPPGCSDELWVDDFIGTPTITESGAALTASGYQLEPLNGIDASGIAVPYTTIRRVNTTWTTTTNTATVSLTARWGWAAIPADVVEGCRVLAKDFASLRDTRFGVAGFGEFGVVRMKIENPQVVQMLASYVRYDRWGIA
jgi:hypothetical protein